MVLFPALHQFTFECPTVLKLICCIFISVRGFFILSTNFNLQLGIKVEHFMRFCIMEVSLLKYCRPTVETILR